MAKLPLHDDRLPRNAADPAFDFSSDELEVTTEDMWQEVSSNWSCSSIIVCLQFCDFICDCGTSVSAGRRDVRDVAAGQQLHQASCSKLPVVDVLGAGTLALCAKFTREPQCSPIRPQVFCCFAGKETFFKAMCILLPVMDTCDWLLPCSEQLTHPHSKVLSAIAFKQMHALGWQKQSNVPACLLAVATLAA